MHTMDDFNEAIDILRNALASIEMAWEDFAEKIKRLGELAIDAEESLPSQKYGTRQKKDSLFRRSVPRIYKADLKRIKKHQPYSRRIF